MPAKIIPFPYTREQRIAKFIREVHNTPQAVGSDIPKDLLSYIPVVENWNRVAEKLESNSDIKHKISKHIINHENPSRILIKMLTKLKGIVEGDYLENIKSTVKAPEQSEAFTNFTKITVDELITFIDKYALLFGDAFEPVVKERLPKTLLMFICDDEVISKQGKVIIEPTHISWLLYLRHNEPKTLKRIPEWFKQMVNQELIAGMKNIFLNFDNRQNQYLVILWKWYSWWSVWTQRLGCCNLSYVSEDSLTSFPTFMKRLIDNCQQSFVMNQELDEHNLNPIPIGALNLDSFTTKQLMKWMTQQGIRIPGENLDASALRVWAESRWEKLEKSGMVRIDGKPTFLTEEEYKVAKEQGWDIPFVNDTGKTP